MNSQYSHLAGTDAAGTHKQQSIKPWLWLFGALATIALVAHHARMGAASPRIANPEVSGIPRPVEFLFGWSDARWLKIHEWGTVLVMLVIIGACVRAWRRQPGHPYVLMTIA